MGILQSIGRLFGAGSNAPASGARMAEAAGQTIDTEDDGWRRLTGDGQRDLLPMNQWRMQRLAHFLWESNLLANRLIELPLAYLLGKGVKWRIEDPDAQTALDRHWKDGLNAWDIKLTKKVRELAMFGEQVWPVFRNAQNGFVRVGYLDPGLIETVVTDPDNREQPIGIVTTKNSKGQAKRYRVIVNVTEAAFTQRTQDIRATFTDGDCFYFRVNDLCNATRGRSDLLPQMDWLDAYDVFLFGELDRAHHMRAFIWDVTLNGLSKPELDARAKSITAPRPNSVRLHNESEKWEAVTPDLKAVDGTATARLFRNHMLGGATVPEHWYGGAEQVNRSTGTSMVEPTEKVLEMRQAYVGYALEQVGQYVVRSVWDALDKDLSEQQQATLDTLRVEWPELTAKDTTKYAAALQQCASGCVTLIAEGVITKLTALRIVAAMAEQLGVEIDPEDELASAQQEMLDASAFNPPPSDGNPNPPPPIPTPPANGQQ